jgi:hypothetical protein
MLFRIILLIPVLLIFFACSISAQSKIIQVTIETEKYSSTSEEVEVVELEGGNKAIKTKGDKAWLAYEVDIPVTGRYQCEIAAKTLDTGNVSLMVEDYYDNTDGRFYNITGVTKLSQSEKYQQIVRDGSPLQQGVHKMKLHCLENPVEVDYMKFILMKKHQLTPKIITQNMEGKDWELVWSDEFDGEGLPDTSKWAFDIGNWGWGNNEPQYYTEFRTENARQENGNLIIEARKNDMGYPWTSARLTTRGKESFLYGKIEFRAMPPAGIGTWAACWFLGDAYRDEISWPYCGEIDVLECVGREIDQDTGDGINHASCHTRAYYFKQGNHLTSTINVKNMTGDFHIYSIEWSPTGIDAFLDGEKYYTYDKLNGEWEWPFNNPQNIIMNLAMGGGMGQDIDENLTSQKLIVDYVRVYQKQ